MQAVGYSAEHTAFAGTLTLSAETATRALIEIGEGVRRAGCRKLVIANSHGGNVALVDIVARELRVRLGLLAVNAAWHRLGYPAGLYSEAETRFGIHAGDTETSLMLAVRPDAVRMDRAEDFLPRSIAMEQRFTHLRATQPIGFAWMSQDLHPAGAMGEAAQATRDKGEASFEHGARAFVELLREVDEFSLEA
jgi:creatinine amidohydrolase